MQCYSCGTAVAPAPTPTRAAKASVRETETQRRNCARIPRNIWKRNTMLSGNQIQRNRV